LVKYVTVAEVITNDEVYYLCAHTSGVVKNHAI